MAFNYPRQSLLYEFNKQQNLLRDPVLKPLGIQGQFFVQMTSQKQTLLKSKQSGKNNLFMHLFLLITSFLSSFIVMNDVFSREEARRALSKGLYCALWDYSCPASEWEIVTPEFPIYLLNWIYLEIWLHDKNGTLITLIQTCVIVFEQRQKRRC